MTNKFGRLRWLRSARGSPAGGVLVFSSSPRTRTPAAAPAAGMHHLAQFRCWKLEEGGGGGGGGSGTSSAVASEPTDDELLTTKPHPNSFRAVIGHLVVTGHLIGVLPVSSAVDVLPIFHWTSPRVLLSLSVVSAIVVRLAVYAWSVYLGFMSAFDTVVSTRLGFHVLSTLQLALYVRLARRWRPFLLCFLRLERRQGDDVLRPRLRLQAKIVSALLLSFALGELVLQETTHALPRRVSEYQSASELLQAHYETLYDNVAQVFSYSLPALLFAECTTAATNLVLNYNDVFVILVSILMVRRFKLMRAELARAAAQVQRDDASYWKDARESFNDLSQLTRDVDNYLSALVLLSCLNNFFSICIQLQHTVRPSYNLGFARKMYFLFSFTFVMLRSAAVVLSASCIPEESKTVKRVLYAVPTKQYSEEVQRFLAQVTTDEISLTGLGLFSITRSFILTMLGTIATYEILLVQMYRTS